MRILHIADEDHVQPGSGGLAIRTWEIARRLSATHEITILVPGYPGAKERIEEGVRWIPMGPPISRKASRLVQLALLGPEILKRPHDVLVEEFAVPFGVGIAPLFTRKPVVASVQWLFASQLSAKYHLPFDRVEQAGLRMYRYFISMSEWLARELGERRPGGVVTTIPNAVDPKALDITPLAAEHLLYVGRLDSVQKGLDLLIDAMVPVVSALGERTPPLLIVGDGPDREQLEAKVDGYNLRNQVRFVGRVVGLEKYRLMAGSYAVLMPSRFETYGIVAAESQAAGAPIVAFDVGPLREVVGPSGRLVAPFDVGAFARQIIQLVSDPEEFQRTREQGRAWARQRPTWDDIATQQGEFYRWVRSGGSSSAAGTQSTHTAAHSL